MVARAVLVVALAAGMLGAGAAAADDVPRDPGDLLASWSPGDDWTVTAVDGISEADLVSCDDGVSTTFAGPAGETAEVYWVRCADPRAAHQFINHKWLYVDSVWDAGFVWDPGIDRATRYENAAGHPVVGRSWVQDDLYLYLDRSCPTGSPTLCARTTITWAKQIAAVLPGEPSPDTSIATFTERVGLWFLVVPVLTFAALIIPKRIVAWVRSRGYSTDTDNPRFMSVDAIVRRARIGRLIRRIIIGVLTVTIYLVSLFSLLDLDVLWFALMFFFGPFVIAFVLSTLLRLLWRPNPLIRVARRRTRLSPLGVVGVGLQGFASAVAAFALLVYIYASTLIITDSTSNTDKLVQAESQELMQISPIGFLNGGLRLLAHALEDTGTYALVFLVLLVAPAFVAYLIDRLGRRLIKRGLQETLEEDTRPYFLYLRGFDEDTLRIDESVGRRGFIELLTPFGRPRFEELLVEYLNQFGPVIAISSSKQLVSDLGAAKVSFDDGEWQEHVAKWVSGARAVVMSATPREVRPGLEWEMEHLATSGNAKRLMLVLAPWKREAVARRWAGFRARADDWPLFAELNEHPMPDGVEVLTWSADRGWHGYGSRRRWDWSYAASILTAADRGDLGDDLARPGVDADHRAEETVTSPEDREKVAP